MQTLYFNPEQTREILEVAGTAGLVLMQHYVAIAHQVNPDMEDGTLANLLGMTERNVKRIRHKLTNAGWFKRTKISRDKETIITYDVGKLAVLHSSPYAAKVEV